jgi:5-formyltetrahydrofolate cyclo-ligase
LKSTIRKQIIKQRKQLSKQDVSLLSAQICNRIISHNCFINSKSIAIYYAYNNEVDLSSLLFQNKTILLPAIKESKMMEFRPYSFNDDLIANKYGILEPSITLPSESMDLCLLPLVGFNRKGDRLGMGAGFYDRYFASNRLNKKATILAGVAYDFQESVTIQSDTWDIPLNYIFTNKEVIKI